MGRAGHHAAGRPRPVARQQQRIGRHLLGQSLAFFVRFPSADLITRVSQAANAASGVMNLLMTRVQDVFTAAALLLAMFKLDWLLSCTALFVMVPVNVRSMSPLKMAFPCIVKLVNVAPPALLKVTLALVTVTFDEPTKLTSPSPVMVTAAVPANRSGRFSVRFPGPASSGLRNASPLARADSGSLSGP